MNQGTLGKINQPVEFIFPHDPLLNHQENNLPDVIAKAELKWGTFHGWYSDADGLEENKITSYHELPLKPDTIYNGAHDFYALFSKTPPESEKILVMEVCNSTGNIQDDFSVILNGVDIGYLEIATPTYGNMYIASPNNDLTTDDNSSGVICPVNNLYRSNFDPIYLAKGQNQIELRNINNNGEGTNGTFEIAYYDIDPAGTNLLVNREFIASVPFTPGPGEDSTLYFNLD